jgi:hypothetical protein
MANLNVLLPAQIRGPEQAQDNIRIEVSARVQRNIFGQFLTFNSETP